eukprot:TRINITY_DN7053_c0_g1_i1.p1 TRINITY_DN7053_c0_g1~~TRINITY_DN7053_c0_g1_i1.p1  ORF type:complete len:396 (-),score=81.33 TRINITY_DN7053_c0_g1_i1:14-1201(-)
MEAEEGEACRLKRPGRAARRRLLRLEREALQQQQQQSDTSASGASDPTSGVLLLYKPVGATPLQIVQLAQARLWGANATGLTSSTTPTTTPTLQPSTIPKVGYAGRLDPMARGLLLCLVGDENKRQKGHELLEKEYKFELLLGVATDTFDVLGLVQPHPCLSNTTTTHNISKRRRVEIETGEDKEKEDVEEEIACAGKLPDTEEGVRELVQGVLHEFVGPRKQKYPPFSSARVRGKPLFHWAKQGPEVLAQVAADIPTVEVTVRSLEILSSRTTSLAALRTHISSLVGTVTCAESGGGDFRQAAVLESWERHVFNTQQLPQHNVHILRLKACVTSGTYIRSIASDIGQRLGVGAIALDINRIRVADYHVSQALHIASADADLTAWHSSFHPTKAT